RLGYIAVDETSLGPGSAERWHRAHSLPGGNCERELGRVPVRKASGAPDLSLQQRDSDLLRPREPLLENLARQLLSPVARQADAPFGALPWRLRDEHRIIRCEARLAADVLMQRLVLVAGRIASQDRLHGLGGCVRKAGLAPGSTDVKSGDETAKAVTRRVAASVVPRLQRAVEDRDRFVPSPHHHQRQRAPGEKMERGVWRL